MIEAELAKQDRALYAPHHPHRRSHRLRIMGPYSAVYISTYGGGAVVEGVAWMVC